MRSVVRALIGVPMRTTRLVEGTGRDGRGVPAAVSTGSWGFVTLITGMSTESDLLMLTDD